jgi:hypothetical protein
MNAVTLRMIALLAVAVPVLPGQFSAGLPLYQTTFTSTDGSFRFSYPGDFQVCTAGKMEPCMMRYYIPPCEEDAIVCVVYPAKKTEGTNFGAAAFQVRKIHTPRETTTPNGCVKPYADDAEGASFRPEYLNPARHPEEIIGGVRFTHGVSAGVAAGHSGSVDAYRNFHQGSCYELSVTRSQTAAANFDPPMKTLTPAAQKEMDEILSRVLHSFRFKN